MTGLARDSAEQLLTDAGLEPAIEETESDKPEDEVISQNPAAGTEVDKGSSVTLTVSKGIETVDVPNVDRVSQPSRCRRTAARRGAGPGGARAGRDRPGSGRRGHRRSVPAPAPSSTKGKQVVIIDRRADLRGRARRPGDQGSSP